MLNARIRKRWLAGNIPIGLIGAETDLTYRVQPLGDRARRADRAARRFA